MMTFFEDLPPQCPPPDAVDKAFDEVWRVVDGASPSEEHFYSHAKRGWPKRPTDTDCDHASCSVFTSRAKIAGLVPKLPKSRIGDPHLVKFAIPEGAGMSIENSRSGHVHFWMAAGFTPWQGTLVVEKP